MAGFSFNYGRRLKKESLEHYPIIDPANITFEMYCEHYRCKMSKKACLKRQSLGQDGYCKNECKEREV